MNKKGQGLPLNVIIIAAIVLIVLVVLWAIFTGRMGVFSKGLTDVTKGGTCVDAGGKVKTEVEGCNAACIRVYGQFSDVNAGDLCCKPAKKDGCVGTYGTQANGPADKECADLSQTECGTAKAIGSCAWTTIDRDAC